MNEVSSQSEPPITQQAGTKQRKPKKPLLIIGIILGTFIILTGVGFGIKYAIDALQPHRSSTHDTAKQPAPSYTTSGTAAEPTDNKGSWLRLTQSWQIPFKPGDQVTYRLTSDGTRAFLAVDSFSTNTQSQLRAYDGASGKLLWQVPFTKGIHGQPAAANGVVIQADSDHNYIAFDAGNGAQLWQRHLDNPFIDRQGTPGVFLDGVFYYSQSGLGAIKDTITGVNPRTGTVRYNHVTPDYFGFQELRVSGNHLVLGTNSGTVVAVKKDTTLLWQHDFPRTGSVPTATYAFGNVVVSTAPVDKDHTMWWAFDSANGKQLWTQATPVASRPTVAGGVLAAMGDVPEWKVMGFDLKTGKQLWTSPPITAGSFGRYGMGAADGTLFTTSHHIEIIDTHDGHVTFHQTMPYGTTTPPVAAGGHIVAVFADGLRGFQ